MPNQSPCIPLEKARGCLLGLAAGEALGLPVEGLSRARLQTHFGQVRDYVQPPAALALLGRETVPGLYGAGTQQALLVAEVLARRGGYDADDARARFLALAQPAAGLARGLWRNAGSTLRAAVERMGNGHGTLETGVPSAGCGAAVRCAPLGLTMAGDAEVLRSAAIACALQTHSDTRAIGAAVGFAHLTGRLASTGNDVQACALLEEAAAQAYKAEEETAALHTSRPLMRSAGTPRLGDSLLLLSWLLETSQHEALRAILLQAGRLQPNRPLSGPGDGFAPAAVPTAIWLALSLPSFEEAVVEAVNLGGAAAHLGALTGALAGARWGEDAIPARWLEGLHNREGIAARAAALLGGVKGAEGWQAQGENEWRLSLALVRAREGW
ncbi:MAG: ADP-ribosylglycohydrolase family protein [Anaerolineae bacterium]